LTTYTERFTIREFRKIMEDFMKYVVVPITALLTSTLLFSEQLPKKTKKKASEL